MPVFGNPFEGGDGVAEMASALSGVATLSHGEIAPTETTILVAGEPNLQHQSLPGLEVVVIPYAGIPRNTAAFARETGVKLVNLHFNAAATAEMAVALLLAAARGVAASDAALRKGIWRGRHDDMMGILLAGKTATVLGYGEIGRKIGNTLQSLGMSVIGVRRRFDADEPEVLGFDQLDVALQQSHALVIAAPLTPETKGMIGSRELDLLRRPRLISNIGRGPIIDEQALYEGCASGEISAAGIDVWYQYPQGDSPTLPSKFPFHELRNVVLSPHRAGTGDDSELLRTQELIQVLSKIARAEVVRFASSDLGY